MYGTTMKNYNVNRASSTKAERKGIFSKKEETVKNNKSKKAEEKDTRYVKIKSSSKADKVEMVDEQVEQDTGFSRKDFPIPSVIITVLMTMMLLVVTVGLLGV